LACKKFTQATGETPKQREEFAANDEVETPPVFSDVYGELFLITTN